MNPAKFHYGFRILGHVSGERRLVDANAAFTGYAGCDERAEVEKEGYLSAFNFGVEFRDFLREQGSCRRFSGPCWSPWIWIDLDREGNVDGAKEDARILGTMLADRYETEEGLLVFFSGAKGFHISLQTALWNPKPSENFHRISRRFAENAAERAGITIDCAVYDRIRAFRAPNSRHPKTGLHKRRITFDALMHSSTSAIVEAARSPDPFEVPASVRPHRRAEEDWAEAERQVVEHEVAMTARGARSTGSASLNRLTLDFIRDGAQNGERAKRLFSAAANLAEFRCPSDLAQALLVESALDSGLSPSEAQRQIQCGLEAGGKGISHG